MEYTQQLWAAAAVLAGMGALLWWLRRRGLVTSGGGRRASERRLETLERLPLSPQHTLHLVRVGGETLLVACSPSGCTMLAQVPLQPMPRVAEVQR